MLMSASYDMMSKANSVKGNLRKRTRPCLSSSSKNTSHYATKALQSLARLGKLDNRVPYSSRATAMLAHLFKSLVFLVDLMGSRLCVPMPTKAFCQIAEKVHVVALVTINWLEDLSLQLQNRYFCLSHLKSPILIRGVQIVNFQMQWDSNESVGQLVKMLQKACLSTQSSPVFIVSTSTSTAVIVQSTKNVDATTHGMICQFLKSRQLIYSTMLEQRSWSPGADLFRRKKEPRHPGGSYLLYWTRLWQSHGPTTLATNCP